MLMWSSPSGESLLQLVQVEDTAQQHTSMASRAATLTSRSSCAVFSQSSGSLRHTDSPVHQISATLARRSEVQAAAEKKGWRLAPVEQTRVWRMSDSAHDRAVQAAVGVAPETLQAVEAVTSKEDPAKARNEEERDFAGTLYVPIYVMLPLNTVGEDNKLHNPEQLEKDFAALKSVGVDGVMCDVWWGLVEREGPNKYDWGGYHELFKRVAGAGLRLQVVMSFHQCGGNVGDDTDIPIPPWVHEIAKENPNIFFTNRKGERNPECLSWGVDKERVLRGRTGLEVYYDFMRSFRTSMDEYFIQGIITEVEVGLGACGELRYPSYPERHGWKYPGIGEFQCYDKYMMAKLTRAAEERNHSDWAHGPEDAGEYNSQPQDTGFFRDGGNFDSYYGRWFLKWYSQQLIEHGDRVLHLADMVFEGTKIAAKVSGIHWWYKTASHAAELCAGFYNPHNRDGYAPISEMLARHNAAFNFTCVELITTAQEDSFPEALADPEGLVWQVLNSAWDAGIPVASENALPCYDRLGYNKILENAKPRKDPDGRSLAAFTYLRLNPTLMEEHNFKEFARFVKRLHGEAVDDLNV